LTTIDKPTATAEQVQLALLQMVVEALPKDQRDLVKMCASRLRLAVNGYGLEGEIAAKLVAAECEAKVNL
jgi:hypothetical protein